MVFGMEQDWNGLGLFFRKGCRLAILPSWRSPRLIMEADNRGSLWRDARFFDAYSLKGRMRRLILRNIAPVLPSKKLSVGEAIPEVDRVLENLGLPIVRKAVVVGYNDQRQKWVVIGLDAASRPLAYVKYGERPMAVKRIDHEAAALSVLPPRTGPELLWHGGLGQGRAFAMKPVDGYPAGPDPFADQERAALGAWLDRLCSTGYEVPAHKHPAIHRVIDQHGFPEDRIGSLLQSLSARQWSMAWQHGDVTPWNILHRSACPEEVCAIDWEDAVPDGFPLFDLVYYVLQAHFLLRGGKIVPAIDQARAWLCDRGLTEQEADSIIRLGACEAWLRWKADGWAGNAPIQQFRRAVADYPLPRGQGTKNNHV